MYVRSGCHERLAWPQWCSMLLPGEDDALVEVAAFQLAVGIGGLLDRHGYVCARSQSRPSASKAIVSSRAAGARSMSGSESMSAEVSSGRVGQRDNPLGSASQGDRVGQYALADRIEDGVHRAKRSDPVGQARAVPYRRGS